MQSRWRLSNVIRFGAYIRVGHCADSLFDCVPVILPLLCTKANRYARTKYKKSKIILVLTVGPNHVRLIEIAALPRDRPNRLSSQKTGRLGNRNFSRQNRFSAHFSLQPCPKFCLYWQGNQNPFP